MLNIVTVPLTGSTLATMRVSVLKVVLSPRWSMPTRSTFRRSFPSQRGAGVVPGFSVPEEKMPPTSSDAVATYPPRIRCRESAATSERVRPANEVPIARSPLSRRTAPRQASAAATPRHTASRMLRMPAALSPKGVMRSPTRPGRPSAATMPPTRARRRVGGVRKRSAARHRRS